MRYYTPTQYELAAIEARKAGDLKAASRLERSGSAACLGHNRAERHRARAYKDWPENLGYSTEEDEAKYIG